MGMVLIMIISSVFHIELGYGERDIGHVIFESPKEKSKGKRAINLNPQI